MKQWVKVLQTLEQDGLPHVLVTIIKVEGSAPRNAGTRMIVEPHVQHGTLGGGNLEFQALKVARELLRQPEDQVRQLRFTLGQDLAQCCGGQVTLMFESFVQPPLKVMLFGAGHVGSALVSILEQLNCEVSWFDTRAEYLSRTVASNVQPQVMSNPTLAVEQCPANSCFLVMTHSHELDFEIVEAVLSRSDIRYCGLIASRSKAARFRQRLRRKQFRPEEMSRLTAPIGLAGIRSKEPMAVAVAVAAELLQLSQATMPVAEGAVSAD
ncbi:MAG: xanthine dehydrogenase accessory protein XdhC [Gammaproteobacteria bacterium]|nr:xanthine dehydrogenase accessory protein XdhC [Gammaproteobacteria bacterium]